MKIANYLQNGFKSIRSSLNFFPRAVVRLDIRGPVSNFSLVGLHLFGEIKTRISSVKLFNFWGLLLAVGPSDWLYFCCIFYCIFFTNT